MGDVVGMHDDGPARRRVGPERRRARWGRRVVDGFLWGLGFGLGFVLAAALAALWAVSV